MTAWTQQKLKPNSSGITRPTHDTDGTEMYSSSRGDCPQRRSMRSNIADMGGVWHEGPENLKRKIKDWPNKHSRK
jgi:hypothetical protein